MARASTTKNRESNRRTLSGGVIARAVCVECGARLVGVADPARPAVGLVWFEMPDSEVSG